MSAGRKAHQRIVFALNAKLICIFGQVLYGIGNIVQWRIVGCIQERAVPQHKSRIAQLVQLVGNGCALVQLCGGVAAVAGHHDGVLCVGCFSREIIQLHHDQRRIFRNFFRGIHLPCDLYAPVVVFDHKVHAFGGILGSRVAYIALNGRIIVLRAALDPFVAVGIVAGAFDAGVLPQLFHGRLCCDVRLAVLCSKCRKRYARQHSQRAHHRSDPLHFGTSSILQRRILPCFSLL